jgi:hypothetical protein
MRRTLAVLAIAFFAAACGGTSSSPDACPDASSTAVTCAPSDASANADGDASIDASSDAATCVPSGADAHACTSTNALACVPLGGADATAGAPSFTAHTLDSAYRGEAAAVFDVDRDGNPDIVTDQFWYAGPGFAQSHEIRAPETANPDAGMFLHDMGVYPWDVNQDGWIDIVVAPHPTDVVFWYENPQCSTTHWTPHAIAPPGTTGFENPIVVDLFGDGHLELLMSDTMHHVIGYWVPPSANPNDVWTMTPITPIPYSGSDPYAHGIGTGDVNGDRRLDVLTPEAWFEQTSDRTNWVQHGIDPSVFANEMPTSNPQGACSRMWSYDIDCDGLADLVCARPHSYGLFWLQQQRAAAGTPDPLWVSHTIDTTTVREMHALSMDDLNGDGVPEIITGEAWMSYPGLTEDPGPLVYYVMHRDASGTSFEPHVVDPTAGAGRAIAVSDLNGDCRPDIVVENKTGLHYFVQQ